MGRAVLVALVAPAVLVVLPDPVDRACRDTTSRLERSPNDRGAGLTLATYALWPEGS